MAKFIKNIDSVSHTYQGQEIAAAGVYEIQPTEQTRFANDSQLLIDIANEKAQIGTACDSFISDINEQITHLKDLLPRQVQTQFERDDVILKIARMSASVGGDSTALCEIKVYGVMANGDGVYISGGEAFFDTAVAGDAITKVEVVDVDDVLGYGAGTVIKTYHDDAVDVENAGWYIPVKLGHAYCETLGFYGFIPAELYIRLVGKKANSITTGTFYVNLEYGRIG